MTSKWSIGLESGYLYFQSRAVFMISVCLLEVELLKNDVMYVSGWSTFDLLNVDIERNCLIWTIPMQYYQYEKWAIGVLTLSYSNIQYALTKSNSLCFHNVTRMIRCSYSWGKFLTSWPSFKMYLSLVWNDNFRSWHMRISKNTFVALFLLGMVFFLPHGPHIIPHPEFCPSASLCSSSIQGAVHTFVSNPLTTLQVSFDQLVFILVQSPGCPLMSGCSMKFPNGSCSRIFSAWLF